MGLKFQLLITINIVKNNKLIAYTIIINTFVVATSFTSTTYSSFACIIIVTAFNSYYYIISFDINYAFKGKIFDLLIITLVHQVQ